MSCSEITDTWIPVKTQNVGYKTEALFVDIPPPEIKYSGNIKFLQDLDKLRFYKVGYLIEVNMGPIDISKVPKKYLQEKKETINGISTNVPPIDSSTYKAEIGFSLRDKDGFELQKIKSNIFYITSGSDGKNRITKIQETVGSLKYELVENTKYIDANLLILECVTCY